MKTITLLLVAASVLLCLHHARSDMSPLDGVKPAWAGEYDVGTRCSCEAFKASSSVVRSMLCYNYRFNQSLAQVTIEFNCTCFDRTHLCSLLPFTDSWMGGIDDCAVYGMNTSVAFTEEAPDCLDSEGADCGILPGRRQQTQYTYNSVDSDFYYCRTDEVKFNCTTGLCTQSPIPCVVQYEGVPWNPCFVSGGTCLKSRIFPITQEPKNGAPPCPVEIERTELAECTAAECSQQPCTYRAVQSTSNCSTVCGEGVQTVTWYNVSVNSLSSCTEGDFESIINQTEIPCAFNFPCDDLGEPIQVTCSSRGNTGPRNEKAEYIHLDFNTTINLTASTSALINSFIVTEATFGRRMALDLSSIHINTTFIDIYFLYGEDDGESTTGYTFQVTFKEIAGLNVSINGNNQRMPYFRISCADQSPPSLHAVFWYNNSETSYLYHAPLWFIFSEPVTGTAEYGVMALDLGFSMSNMEALDPGTMTPTQRFIGTDYLEFSKFFICIEFQFNAPFQTAGIGQTAGSFKDLAGNVNLNPQPGNDLQMSITNYSSQVYFLSYPDSLFTFKLVSTSGNGTVNAIFVLPAFPFTPDNLLNNVKYGRLSFEVYPDDPDVYSPSEFVYRDITHIDTDSYIDYNGDEIVTSYMVYFDGFDALGKRYYPAAVDSVYLGIVAAYLRTSPELILQNRILPTGDKYPQWTVGSTLNAVPAVSYLAPVVLSAKTYINSTTLYVTMSRWAPTSESFSATTFNYTGLNSIARLLSVTNNTYVSFEMTLPYTYDMILADVISYNGTYTGGEVDLAISEASWRYKNVTLFNGTRPAVLLFSLQYVNDSEVESSSYGFSTQSTFHTMSTVTTTPPTVANTLVINFDTAIDPATAGVTDFLITPANPLISSVTVESVTMSNNDKTATLKLSTACKGSTCFDTGPQLVSLSITGITDIFGNRITQFISSTAFDLMPPSLMSVTCITSKTCQLTFTEPVKDLQLGSIAPSPVACYPSQSAILYYADRKPVGTKFYFTSNSDIRDLSGNLVAMGEETAVKMGSNTPYKKCGSVLDLDTAAKAGFFAMVGIAGVILIVWGIVGGVYWSKVSKLKSTGKNRSVEITQKQEKAPLINKQTAPSASSKPVPKAAPKAPPPGTNQKTTGISPL